MQSSCVSEVKPIAGIRLTWQHCLSNRYIFSRSSFPPSRSTTNWIAACSKATNPRIGESKGTTSPRTHRPMAKVSSAGVLDQDKRAADSPGIFCLTPSTSMSVCLSVCLPVCCLSVCLTMHIGLYACMYCFYSRLTICSACPYVCLSPNLKFYLPS